MDPDGSLQPLAAGGTLRLHASPVILDSDARDRYARQVPNPPLARNGLAILGTLASGSSDDGFHGPELAVDGDTDSQWIGPGFRQATASFAVELAERSLVR
ncbi:MAG: hypothetical protein ACK4YP_12300, partial [Myxococcota bacterium]